MNSFVITTRWRGGAPLYRTSRGRFFPELETAQRFETRADAERALRLGGYRDNDGRTYRVESVA